MSQAPTILVVEDEREMHRFLRVLLESHGYRILAVDRGEDALREIATWSPDAVLLDLGLPDMDGFEVTRRVREWSQVPIVVISARGREDDKVEALDLGADDYVTKPFGSRELLARLRAALRRNVQKNGAPSRVRFGEVEVDRAERRVVRAGEEIHLTPTEYKLLSLLVAHAGRVLSHRQILREVWGPNYVEQGHYVRVYVGQLRQKLECDPARPQHLTTETGVGYRLVGVEEEGAS